MSKSLNKALFLDRDGVINIEKHYLYKIEDFELVDYEAHPHIKAVVAV